MVFDDLTICPEAVIAVDGSSTVFPISEAVAEEFRSASAARVTIGVSGTGGGFKKFCSAEIAISGASRPIKPSEVLACEKAGIEYIGDWVLDDEPVTLKTTHKPVVALPYNFELHDIVMMALQNHASEEMYRRSMDAFDCLYEESKDRAKIMSIAVHPYLSGQTHRIKHVERAFEDILSKPGVACWSGEKILDWYLGTQKEKT